MKTRRILATCVVALLSVVAVLAKDVRTVIFKVPEMHCEKCEKKVKQHIRFEKGVKKIITHLKSKTVTITYDAEKCSVKDLQEAFGKLHYKAAFVKETKEEDKK